MKIRDILLTLLTEGDVSDHHNPQAASWYHGIDCAFCEAARAAEMIIDSIPLRDVFDPGHEVAIGDVTGIVENVDIVYTVRITDANGNRRYGRFASEYVGPAVPPIADEYFSDRDGDIWQVSGPERPYMLVCIESDGNPTTVKSRPVLPKAFVAEQWGPLKSVKR